MFFYLCVKFSVLSFLLFVLANFSFVKAGLLRRPWTRKTRYRYLWLYGDLFQDLFRLYGDLFQDFFRLYGVSVRNLEPAIAFTGLKNIN